MPALPLAPETCESFICSVAWDRFAPGVVLPPQPAMVSSPVHAISAMSRMVDSASGCSLLASVCRPRIWKPTIGFIDNEGRLTRLPCVRAIRGRLASSHRAAPIFSNGQRPTCVRDDSGPGGPGPHYVQSRQAGSDVEPTWHTLEFVPGPQPDCSGSLRGPGSFGWITGLVPGAECGTATVRGAVRH